MRFGFSPLLAIVIFVGITLIVNYNLLGPFYQPTLSASQNDDLLEIDDSTVNSRVKIVRWNINSLHLFDSQRILVHETVSNGDLNVRQSCAIESAAKHNSDRSIHLIMRQPQSPTEEGLDFPWLDVLRHYSKNVQVVLIEEAEYFNDTGLNDWYNRRHWRSNPHQMAFLSDFTRAVSIFRGGGLHVDINKVVVVKPLTGSKWNNFFVKLDGHDIAKSAFQSLTTGEIFHLVHGHHLVDLLIANLADVPYDPRAPEHEAFSSVLDATLAHVCGEISQLANGNNHCLDVKLLDIHRVFVPYLDSLMRRLSPLFQVVPNTLNTEHSMTVSQILKNLLSSHEAVLLEWNSIESLQSILDSKSYQRVCLSLLAQHCPQTVIHRDLFLDSILC